MNRAEYTHALRQDLRWLEYQPEGPERNHLLTIVHRLLCDNPTGEESRRPIVEPMPIHPALREAANRLDFHCRNQEYDAAEYLATEKARDDLEDYISAAATSTNQG